MTKYLLHGGYTRRDNELNRTFFEEFVRDIPDGGTILMVFFASTKDPTDSIQDIETGMTKAAQAKQLYFVLATEQDFLAQLTHVDAVYFHGGNTNKLLDTLRAYGDLKPLFEGKTVAGSSAGAYVLAKYGAAHSEEHMREELGILPLRVVCHYESPDHPPHTTSLKELEGTATDLELVLLHDCEWKVFTG